MKNIIYNKKYDNVPYNIIVEDINGDVMISTVNYEMCLNKEDAVDMAKAILKKYEDKS